MTPKLLIVLASLMTITACSSKSSSGSDAQIIASATCTMMQKCDPIEFTGEYSSMSDCTSDYTAIYASELPIPGVTESEISEMVSALNGASCAQLTSGSGLLLSSYGSYANGTACWSSSQCQSGNCDTSAGTCGTCVGSGSGATCASSSECEAFDTCIGGSCQTRLANGTTCTYSSDCNSGYCNITGTATTGQCEDYPAGAALGVTCVSGTTYVTCASGLVCDTTTSKCAQPTYVGVGSACNTGTVYCQGSYCDTATNKCAAYLAEGAPCDTSTNDHCVHTCKVTAETGTAGTCAYSSGPDPTCN